MITLYAEMEGSILTKRGHNKMMRVLLMEAMQEHRWNTLPQHFERNAKTAPGGEYGYRKRTAKYQRRKAKKVGHQIPLVLTGRLAAMIQSNAKITATSKQARLRTRGYFPMKVELRKEIEVISSEEQSKLKNDLKRKYVEYAKLKSFQDFVRKR